MIVAVDYDGTLFAAGEMNHRLISDLKNAQRRGDIVILWTCRAGASLKEAVSALAKEGFFPNFINQNAPAVVRTLGHDTRKVFADLYIDDRSVKP